MIRRFFRRALAHVFQYGPQQEAAEAPFETLPILAHKCSDPISVKSTIGKQHRSRSQAGQQIENTAVVVRLASGQRETDRQPTGIDDRMNLGRQSASRQRTRRTQGFAERDLWNFVPLIRAYFLSAA